MTAAVVVLAVGRLGHPVGRCVGLRAGRGARRTPPSRSRHWGWGWWARCCCPGSSCGRCGRRECASRRPNSPRARGRWSRCSWRLLGGLAWAGHDVITIDGARSGWTAARRRRAGTIADEMPGGLGDIGGLLPDRLGDLVERARRRWGSRSTRCRRCWAGSAGSLGVLLIALLASRRTPLPRGWEALHRVVRPAVSALVAVLLVAVLAGFAAAAYAAIGDDHPRRIAGAALLGAPNGVWLGVPLGLFVPWDGQGDRRARRAAARPPGRSAAAATDRPARHPGRGWPNWTAGYGCWGSAAALMMLCAGVLTAVRTPVRGPGARRRGEYRGRRMYAAGVPSVSRGAARCGWAS